MSYNNTKCPEIWRDTEFLNYQVSNFGRVRRDGRVLSPFDNGMGYKAIAVSVLGKVSKPYIHRLVAKAFLPNPNNWPCVNHKNGNPADNNSDNLEWCTHRFNSIHARKVLKHGTPKASHVLCVETNDVFESARVAEKKVGMAKGSISRAIKGRAKTAMGYHWEFTDKEPTNFDSSKYRKRGNRLGVIANKMGIKRETLRARLKRGWTWDKAVSVPAVARWDYKAKQAEKAQKQR